MAREKDEIGEGEKGEKATPEAEPKITPEAEPTEEVKLSSKEHQDLIRQAKSATELGRTLKTTLEANTVIQRNYDLQGKRLSGLEKTIQTIRQQERERELNTAQGNSEVLDTIRLKHQAEDKIDEANKRLSEVEERETRYQTRLDKMAKDEATELAKELAKTSGVTATLLLQIATDTVEDGKTSYNLERMKSIAKSNPRGEEEVEEEETTKGQRALAASMRGGARGYRTAEDYDRGLISGEISDEQYREGMRRLNVNI